MLNLPNVQLRQKTIESLLNMGGGGGGMLGKPSAYYYDFRYTLRKPRRLGNCNLIISSPSATVIEDQLFPFPGQCVYLPVYKVPGIRAMHTTKLDM